MARVGDTDLSVEEIASVLATIAGVEASEITGWIIGIALHHHPDGESCHERTAVLSSECTTYGADQGAELRLVADVLSSIGNRFGES